MTFSFHLLNVFVTQSLNPIFLCGRDLLHSDFEKWKSFLSNEGQAMRLQMLSVLLGGAAEVDKRNCLKSVQVQLVMMSDRVNHYLFRDKKIWMGHPDAHLIKANYLMSLTFFQDQLEFSAINFPSYYDQEVKITDYYLRNDLPQLRNKLYQLKEHLSKNTISPKLIGIIINGLCGMLQNQQLSPKNSGYINRLVAEFFKFQCLNEDDAVDLLIKLNFNQPHFYLYVSTALAKKLVEINGLHEQKEIVLQRKEDLKSLNAQSLIGLHPEEMHIREEIIHFLTEKSSYLDELMALRRVAVSDKYESEKAFRMLVGLTVPQLALFFRIQMENGIIAKDRITEVYNFVAHHFYTEKAIFISAQNLLQRSTDVEFSTAVKLWDILSQMLEWLDTNYSVRNYQRSVH